MARKKNDQLFIRLHDGMPDHPKIELLSDKAFRLLIETWCWCARQRTDGRVPAASWAKRGTAKTRQELIDARLFEDDLAGGVIARNWDEWQLTSAEIEQVIQDKTAAGVYGAHVKWHVNRGMPDDNCQFCQRDSSGIAGANDGR